MSYDEAVKKLQAKGSEIQWGSDFGNTDETILTDDPDRPLMVDRFPAAFKAFYFSRPRTSRGGPGRGLLAPEGYGEIIGGGERIHDRNCCSSAWRSIKLPREPTSGTWTSASTAASPTPASAWGWNAPWRGSAACRTFAKPSPSPA